MPGSNAPHVRRAVRLLAAIQVFLLLASLFAPIPIAAADPSPDPSAPATSAEASPSATAESTPDPSPVPTPDSSPTPAPEATSAPTPAPTAAPTAAPTTGPTDQYVVTFAAGTSAEAQAASLSAAGAVDLGSIPVLWMHAAALTAGALSVLQADPRVARVDLDRTRAAEAVPSDTGYASQWSLPKIGWDQVYGSVSPAGSAVVALLDTGVNASHPDLAGSLVAGTSILDGSSGATDPNGHGTWLAGIIAAQTDNGAGIAGIGYAGVKVMPVTVLDSNGLGQDSDIIEGIVWATSHGADVINMSFSNPGYSPALQAAIDYAWAHGAIVVAATGNDGSSAVTYPAGDRSVVGVSNTDQNDALNASSNYGQDVFLGAPGTDIQTTTAGGGYTAVTGTSASAAEVSAAAALLKAADPSASNGVIVGRLARSADPAGTAAQTGNGRLNLARAIADSGTASVQPAGAAPLGSGGPLVGPYVAAAGGGSFSINDVSVTEGTGVGTTVATFTLSLLRTKNGATSVHWATASNTAVGGTACTAGVDFISASDDWNPGGSTNESTSVPITICRDSVAEATETFFVNLSNPTPSGDSTISDSQGVGTILDDDATAAPVVTTSAGTTAYTENGAALAVDGAVTVTDADSTNLTGATVAITTNFASGQDVLSFTNQLGITGSYNAATGVLSLTGTSTVANYQTALRTVAYSNASDNPSTATRTVSFSATDGTNTSNTATKQVSVIAVNDAPVANNDAYTTAEDSTLTVSAPGVLINDTDVDGPSLTATLVSTTTNGSLTLIANGSFTYTPALNFNGTDSFRYKANDGTADSNVATVTITITPVNDAPVANNDAYTTAEDSTLTVSAPGVLINDTDVDGPSLTATLVSTTTNGSLTLIANGSFTYTPALNFNGTDSFRYKANDGTADSNVATVTITITPDNDAPQITSYTVPGSINEHDTATATVLFTDVEADQTHTCVFTWGEGPSTNVAVAAGVGACSANHQYLDDDPTGTASDNYSVSVTVTDNGTTNGAPDPKSDTASATITVNNVAPTVDAGSNGSIDEGSTFGTTGSFTDPGNDTWTATVDYGDGSGAQALTLDLDKTFSLNHVYADNVGSPFTVTVRVTDDDGGIGTDTLQVTVANVAPVVTPPDVDAPANQGATEGSVHTFTIGSFTDAGVNDGPWSVDVNWGDGSTHDSFLASSQGSLGTRDHTYADNGTYTVRVTVTDKDGGSGYADFSVTVANVAPTATLSNGGPVNEGSTGSVSFSNQFDPSSVDTAAGFTYSYDFDNDGTFEISGSSSPTATVPATFLDDGPGSRTVRARIADKDGGYTDYTTTITIISVAPSGTFGATSPISEGSSSTLSWPFVTDPSSADTAAGFRYSFRCDGNVGLLNGNYATAQTSNTFSCTFDDNGDYAVVGRVIDKNNASTTTGAVVHVNNVAPTVDAGSNGSIDEGSTFGTTGSFTDPGNDTWTATVDYGDGSGAQALTLDLDKTFSLNHVYADNVGSPFTVTVRVTDDDGGIGTDTLQVTVANVAPSATFNAPTSVGEGSAIALSLTGPSDPSSADTAAGFTYAFDCGTGSGFSAFSSSNSASCPTTDSGTRTVKGKIRDKDGGEREYSASVTITNVAPANVSVSMAPAAISENGSATLTGSFTDPGTADTHTIVITWGDGSLDTTLPLAAGVLTFSTSHQYLDDNPTGTSSDVNTVSVTVTDDDGGSGSGLTTITVSNVAPVIASVTGPAGPIALGGSATITASFTDVGSTDTHTCTFNWDDGAPNTALVPAGMGNGSCSATHTYAAAGVYTVAVTVTDDDTGSATSKFEFVVIFDANAGFVTGGGWINSPVGAYVVNPLASGKANFGFVSKYQKGATIPTGETEFQLQFASFNFHSEAYSVLVISSFKAQYKGTGTLNGQTGYSFTLTAYDGQINGGGGVDRFRIKIKDSGGAVVYDNSMGSSDDIDTANPEAISGGSIVIHK